MDCWMIENTMKQNSRMIDGVRKSWKFHREKLDRGSIKEKWENKTLNEASLGINGKCLSSNLQSVHVFRNITAQKKRDSEANC
uniref:Uncharacterized protein n=1 Tax=Romanomermis culicivorax TaxID=13658 RepID=A0A915IU98_ROMCU